MGHVFQPEWRGEHYSGHHLWLINDYENWHSHWQRKPERNGNLI